MDLAEPGLPPAAVVSFEELFRAQYEPMVRLAYLLTRSRAVAEDLVQDSFVRVRPRLDGLEAPAAYLRRTVTNACYSWHRRRRREQTVPVDPPGAADAAPEELWDALAGLAPKRRAVLVLRYYLDLSEAEIADTLGVRPGTVKSLCHRALADLRQVIEP